MLRVLPHRLIRLTSHHNLLRSFIPVAKMATNVPDNKTPIPAGTSASGKVVPPKATGKKVKDDNTPSYPLEVCDCITTSFVMELNRQIVYSKALLFRSQDRHVRAAQGRVHRRAQKYVEILCLQSYNHLCLDRPRQAIQITMPDGSARDGTSYETSPMDIAKAISKSLSERVVIAKVNTFLINLKCLAKHISGGRHTLGLRTTA